MIKLNLEHSRADVKNIQAEIMRIKELSTPDFAKYNPHLDEIKRVTKKYLHYKNIIVVGNGGAINFFRGFYHALARGKTTKQIEILNTVEPDYINELKAKYSPSNTLIVIISKSGTNPTAMEILFAFKEYLKLAVCTEGDNALFKIVQKEKWDYTTYPTYQELSHLEDRHTGFMASGLTPAALVGVDIIELCEGARIMYDKCAPNVPIENNPALSLAATLYALDQKGFTEIFCPVYSTKLYGFLPGIIQMLHETACKDGKGQTIFGDLAPESQHHTNQRFFGGRKNILGLFIHAGQEDSESKVSIPADLFKLEIRGGNLKYFDGVPYSKLLEFEFQGTLNDAIDKNIPIITLEMEEISPKSVGMFLALFQYVSVYLAHLNGVNPLGQPQVERGKDISFELVKEYNKS
jgi:glucose-6-phosphate isomerase